jgi:hypothetical protein
LIHLAGSLIRRDIVSVEEYQEMESVIKEAKALEQRLHIATMLGVLYGAEKAKTHIAELEAENQELIFKLGAIGEKNRKNAVTLAYIKILLGNL